MRTNRNGVTEVASIRMDQEEYAKEHERIFGQNTKKFCDDCGNRIAYCECNYSLTPTEKDAINSFIDTLPSKPVISDFEKELLYNLTKTRMFKIPANMTDHNEKKIYWLEQCHIKSALEAHEAIIKEIKEESHGWSVLAKEASDEVVTLRVENDELSKAFIKCFEVAMKYAENDKVFLHNKIYLTERYSELYERSVQETNED